MKAVLIAVGLIAVVAAISPSLSAQWPAYPTPGVPKTPDGKPDLTAPPPRTLDGRPDLSGVWTNVRMGGRGGRGQEAAPPAPPASGPPLGNFRDAGTGFPGGLPFTPWAAELQKNRHAENSKDNPDALCLPMGLLQFHGHGMPRKMIQNPSVIVILYEANGGMRQIFTDGRGLPNNDPQPWWYGYSTGKWVGDTLVVESTGFRDDGWLDIVGSPLTEAAKLTERFRRVNFGNLEIDVTVDDPKAYTKPWTVRYNQRLVPDQELMEFVCAEGQKFDKYLRGEFKK
jgi:hypothetical protein